MAHGWWGSRFPVGNLLSSKLVRLLVRYRLSSQRFRSRITLLRKQRPAVHSTNTSATADEMEKWLNGGFDKLNIGGGARNLAGFINVDFVRHESVEREIVANALDLSFVPSSRISQIHTSHMLEHLRADDISRQLEQYYRILKPDGILTIRVPNTLGAAYAFWFEPILESDREEFVLSGYPRDEAFGDPRDGWLHRDLYGLLHWFYGEVGNPANEHLTRITPSWLQDQLRTAGFRINKISKPETLNIVVVAGKTA
jgi:hypothetical protein